MARENILIAGMAKTGTTGVYNLIKRMVSPEEYYFLFEPTRARQVEAFWRYNHGLSLLTKVMVARWNDLRLDESRFQKRVLIVRDPRDMLVSLLLFRPFVRADLSEKRLRKFLTRLEEKLVNPDAVSLKELHDYATGLKISAVRWDRLAELLELQIRLAAKHAFHRVCYEDFVDGRNEALLDYLGFVPDSADQDSEETSGTWLQHIIRSKQHGEWRRWFTEEDVAYFKPYLAEFIGAFGYSEDWESERQPRISRETSIDYIVGKFQSRKQQIEVKRGRGLAVSETDFGYITSIAADGNAEQMHRVAMHYATGTFVPRNLATAEEWWHRSAIQGQAEAQYYLWKVQSRQEPSGSADEWKDRYFWLREAAVNGFPAAMREWSEVLARGTQSGRRKNAREWLEKAAAAGDLLANIQLYDGTAELRQRK